jgi:hypothetical protein
MKLATIGKEDTSLAAVLALAPVHPTTRTGTRAASAHINS